MLADLKFAHKAALLVVIPAIFELTFGCALFVLLRQAENNILREAHANTVIASSNRLIKSFGDAATALFAYSVTGSDMALDRYSKLDRSISENLTTLQLLVGADAAEEEAFRPVRAASDSAFAVLRKARLATNAAAKSGDLQRPDVDEIAERSAMLTDTIHEFVLHEQRSVEAVSEMQAGSRKIIFGLLIAGMLGGIALALGLAMAFHRGTLSRLNILMDNLVRLGKQEPLNSPLQGSDELSQLDSVFHKITDALADANRRKRELLAMVTHDLRTPLMTVQMALSMLANQVHGEIPDQSLRHVHGAQSSVERLIALINDLLDIEKMEAGKLEVSKDAVMVQDLFERTTLSIGQYAEHHAVNLRFETTEIEIHADADRILQVLINLVSNAVKFSQPGAAVVLSAVAEEDTVEVRVLDEGRGVPEDQRAAIFERFSQVDKEDARHGTGLGLAICKMIVDSHNGEIGVRAGSSGKGSEFWFKIAKAPYVVPTLQALS